MIPIKIISGGLKCYVCSICQDLSVSLKDWNEHRKIHLRFHREHINFNWWLGLQTHQYLIKDDMHIKFTPDELNAYHELYQEYLRGTCANTPCFNCMIKNALRTMPEKRKKLLDNRNEMPKTKNMPDEVLVI